MTSGDTGSGWSGYPAPGYSWPPVQPPPRPPSVRRVRHSGVRWASALTGVFVICAFATLGGLVGFADLSGRLDTKARWSAPAAAAGQNAPAAEWTTSPGRAALRLAVQVAVDHAVHDQAKAMIAGNLAAYLGDVDPANAVLVANLKRRFADLHAMGIGVWTESAPRPPSASGEQSWQSDIDITYCFGDASCQPVDITVTSEWKFSNDRLVMVDLANSDPTQMGPRPWETDDLSVATGQRVVVATTKPNAWRLPDAVRAADRAAQVADTMARWDPPPSRYVVFLAGPAEWKHWYGHEQPEWAAGWAVEVSRTTREIMVRTQAVQQRGLESLLTHEMTHVTTLAGKRAGADRHAWWLIEGIADYATMIGKSVAEYDAYVPTHDFVNGKWNGDPIVDQPDTNVSLEEASARYGIAFLAVRRIAAVYGQDRMLDFFGRIVHDDDTAEVAAAGALGADWAQVKADCAQYVRDAVS